MPPASTPPHEKHFAPRARPKRAQRLKMLDAHAQLPPHCNRICRRRAHFVAQLVIQPVDTVKTLVMDSSSAESSPARFARLARERGVLALYRGLLPALMRQGPVMLVQLPLTEQIRRVFGLGYF